MIVILPIFCEVVLHHLPGQQVQGEGEIVVGNGMRGPQLQLFGVKGVGLKGELGPLAKLDADQADDAAEAGHLKGGQQGAGRPASSLMMSTPSARRAAIRLFSVEKKSSGKF